MCEVPRSLGVRVTLNAKPALPRRRSSVFQLGLEVPFSMRATTD
jgi:hypothetical protein